jgi:hypothetical protein
MAKKLILKLKLASVGSRDFPQQNFPPPTNPNNIGSLNVFTDDITEINGDTSLRGEHSGFCFHVRQPDFWLCQAVYTLPGIKRSDSGTAVKFRLEDVSTSPSKSTQWLSPEGPTITVVRPATSRSTEPTTGSRSTRRECRF